MVYPQATACWDTLGLVNEDTYLTYENLQIEMLKAIIDRMVEPRSEDYDYLDASKNLVTAEIDDSESTFDYIQLGPILFLY